MDPQEAVVDCADRLDLAKFVQRRSLVGAIEPLAALYKREPWVAAARTALARERRNVSAALDDLRVVYYHIVPEDEPALANVNTPSDYERLRSASNARNGRS